MKISLLPIIAFALISCTDTEPAKRETPPESATNLESLVPRTSARQLRAMINREFPREKGFAVKETDKPSELVSKLFSQRVERNAASGAIGFGGQDFTITQINAFDAPDSHIGYFYARFPTQDMAQKRHAAIFEKIRFLKSKILTPVKIVQHNNDLVIYYTESQNMAKLVEAMQ